MKKILCILLGLFLFVFGMVNVNAETITLEQVAKKVEEIIKEENTSDLSFTVETTTNSMTLKGSDGFALKFDYENDILSTKYKVLSSSSFETMEEYMELAKEDKKYDDAIGLVMFALVELHEYTERDWRLFSKSDTTLEQDGYEYKPLNGTEMYFKADINRFNLELEYTDAPAPAVKIYEVTKNSIWVYSTANVSDGTMVELYCSEDGVDFEYCGGSSINSGKTSGRRGFEELEPEKTIYFKSVVEKSKNFSDVLKVTTLSENEDTNNSTTDNTNNNSTNDEIDSSKDSDITTDNPKTGMFNPIVVCSILAVTGILLISIINKKNIIKKI